MVFLPFVFEVYKQVSAKWIKSFGCVSELGMIVAMPILIVTISAISELRWAILSD
jgi:hypothetical protein